MLEELLLCVLLLLLQLSLLLLLQLIGGATNDFKGLRVDRLASLTELPNKRPSSSEDENAVSDRCTFERCNLNCGEE